MRCGARLTELEANRELPRASNRFPVRYIVYACGVVLLGTALFVFWKPIVIAVGIIAFILAETFLRKIARPVPGTPGVNPVRRSDYHLYKWIQEQRGIRIPDEYQEGRYNW